MDTLTPLKPNNRVKMLRDERGLSQKALAEATGIPQPDISAFECGRRVGPKTTLALSRFFDVDARFLLGETDRR